MKPLEWIKPNIKGKPPLPRYSHSLNFYEEGNFLIVHGGRNDLKSQTFALNDTHIFDLSKMEWQEIKLYSELDNFKVFNRCGHSAIISSKIFLFYFLRQKINNFWRDEQHKLYRVLVVYNKFRF